jgi:hypothetical protein
MERGIELVTLAQERNLFLTPSDLRQATRDGSILPRLSFLQTLAFSTATDPAVLRGPIRFLCPAIGLILFFRTVWAVGGLITCIYQAELLLLLIGLSRSTISPPHPPFEGQPS